MATLVDVRSDDEYADDDNSDDARRLSFFALHKGFLLFIETVKNGGE